MKFLAPALTALWITSLAIGTLGSGLSAGSEQTPSDGIRGESLLKSLQPVHVAWSAAPKATVLVFLSAKCPCSNAHIDVLADYAQRPEWKSEFKWYAIHSNSDESLVDTTAYFASKKLPFEVIQDAKSAIANQLGALKTPHVFILSPQGETLYQGGVDDSQDPKRAKKHYLEDALKALHEGKKIDAPLTRSLGCVISRES